MVSDISTEVCNVGNSILYISILPIPKTLPVSLQATAEGGRVSVMPTLLYLGASPSWFKGTFKSEEKK